MITVTVEEAQAQLPELIEKAVAGEEVVITRGDAPAVTLSAQKFIKGNPTGTIRFHDELAPKEPRVLGAAKGKVWIADDFDAPIEDFTAYM